MPFDEQRARRQADPVLAEFFGGTTCPSQAQLDFLTKRHGVPALALAQDADGGGYTIGTAFVAVDGLFDFTTVDGTGAAQALVFVARDTQGEPRDLVAWQPRRNVVSAHSGRIGALGEHEIYAPRFGEPLTVHHGIIDWLKAGRAGIVVIDPERAWRCLEGITLAAANVEHGLDLRRRLMPPAPRILVPRLPMGRAA